MKQNSTQLKSILFFILVLPGLATTLLAQRLDVKTAANIVRQNAFAIGLSKSDLQNFRVSDAYIDKLSGLTMIYLQQTYKTIDVFNSVQSLAFRNDKLVSAAGSRIAKIDEMVNEKYAKASVSAADAVKVAAAHLKLSAPVYFSAGQQINSHEFEFGNLGISSVNVKSKLIWLPNEAANAMILTWQTEIQPNGSSDYWLVNVDAAEGIVINKINLTVSCKWADPKMQSFQTRDDHFSPDNFVDYGLEGVAAIDSATYRVIGYPAESPIHPGGKAALKTNPWELAGAANNATTLKWNDDGLVTYDSSRGNNVLAQEDRNGNNGLGLGSHSSTPAPDLLFDYKPKYKNEPTTSVNQQFAITNLFYWNNIMHDISYQYGFDEASGNFQQNNLSRGGLGNDYVFADAQDGSGTNNANFSTPADGTSPRMQMYLFDGVPSLVVNQPSSFAGSKPAVESAFSSNNKLSDTGPVGGNVILYADNAADTSHRACAAAFNAGELNGNIALIDRGDCDFTVKVKNAQNAGAIAAIIADNIPGEYPFPMGGTDNTVTIPAIMVSFENGDTMKQILATNTVLAVTIKAGVHLDGDLDNGVICHEYTHGISNRLTGGASNVTCLSNAEQMGEGWSDYMALMATTKWGTATVTDGANARPLGTYVSGQPTNGPGIRIHPYSTDMSIDPWTYADIASTGGEVHAIGEIWCTVLWEMTWDIIQQAGIKSNLYKATLPGGNNIALRLVMQGLKLQPCKPGFVDGRNAILKADTILYGGTYSAAIWKAFAKRGLGVNASQGTSNNYRDGAADYTEPSFAPVTQQDFSAIRQNSTALLQWRNAGQRNTSAFIIERSKDGANFQPVGSVSTDSRETTTYSFVDQAPLKGVNYYRLHETAADGSVAYSVTRSLSFSDVNIVPNPAKDKITITVAGNSKPLTIYVVSSTGKQLISYNMNGEYLNVKLPILAAGLYYIQIKGEGISDAQKLVIQ